jgi:hypothetical protein
MAHEQEMVPLHTLQARGKVLDERWPVPYAIMFVTVVSVALWALIIALTRWLLG